MAYEITKNIDENDTVFVALTLESNGFLWSGDKKLIKGLKQKGRDFIKSTDDLLLLRGF